MKMRRICKAVEKVPGRPGGHKRRTPVDIADGGHNCNAQSRIWT
jgi:hypothetical protein